MRHDTQTRPTAQSDLDGDAVRTAALHRLAVATDPPQPRGGTAVAPLPDSVSSPAPATASAPSPTATGHPVTTPEGLSDIPWANTDLDGLRPERVPPDGPDIGAWADPPWWERIRWAPSRLAGIALVVLVVALGAFSVHRLLAAVPAGPPVPELPMAEPGETVAPDGSSSVTSTPVTALTGETGETGLAETPVVVSVVGLVGRSGLVTVAPGARVADVLDGAGGVLEGGDRDGLNLARKVVDGEQILVGLAPGPEGPRGPRSGIVGPESVPAPVGPSPAGSSPPQGASSDGGGLVNINAADATGLESLPGVGPVTAAAILSWREANGPFSSVDQLAEVDGIGPATLGRLRPLVTV